MMKSIEKGMVKMIKGMVKINGDMMMLEDEGETRMPCSSSPPTLCSRRTHPVIATHFRPKIRQSLGISPYFLVLEHLSKPRNSPSLLEISNLRCLLAFVRWLLLVWV
ncbi:hypothetical protein SLEP1_g15115 [Rubroshorea leprosula]|uniref:Uncharacterized protein n=1 Tax=Rubroshorea leprosula TaxID=152421 RepID=A0AAV5IU63_9ROSI|nr:hypothetical protein SLEP1_g15115 [Rubroshorea leprosula]